MPLTGVNERIADLCRRLANDGFLTLALEWKIRTELKALLAERARYEDFQEKEAQRKKVQAMDQSKRRNRIQNRPEPEWTRFPIPLESNLGIESNICETATTSTETDSNRTQNIKNNEGYGIPYPGRSGKKA